MPYARAKSGAVTPFWYYGNFHDTVMCKILLVPTHTTVLLACTSCKVVAPIETVAYRIPRDEVESPAPEEEQDGDTGK